MAFMDSKLLNYAKLGIISEFMKFRYNNKEKIIKALEKLSNKEIEIIYYWFFSAQEQEENEEKDNLDLYKYYIENPDEGRELQKHYYEIMKIYNSVLDAFVYSEIDLSDLDEEDYFDFLNHFDDNFRIKFNFINKVNDKLLKILFALSMIKLIAYLLNIGELFEKDGFVDYIEDNELEE